MSTLIRLEHLSAEVRLPESLSSYLCLGCVL